MTQPAEDESAASGRGAGAPVGEIRTSVTVGGDVNGQLAVGSHIVQMRVDTVLGNLVTVLPPDARTNVIPRPVPISLVPRRPAFVVGRQQETALAVEALATRRPVELYGPAGIGKSTLLRSLAHQLPITEACGGMAHLSARGLSHDDLLQVLFDVFYSSDIPVRPTPGELRHYLQHARAALLLDDVTLVEDDVADVEDYAPECGFVLTTASGTDVGDALSIELTGLQGAAARALVAHALGRPVGPDEQPVVDVLCGLVGGAPAGLLRLAAAARTSGGTLAEFAENAAASGAPPPPVDSAEDVRLLGLLAAIPGVQLGVEELSAMTGFGDVQERLDRLVARGLALTSAPPVSTRARIAYSLADGVELGPPLVWQVEQRRAEVRQYFLDLAERRSETLLAPGAPAETLRAVHADAARHREWRYVLLLGVLLGAAYALSGRWDAWRQVAQHELTAARVLGDRPAEAMALHQLGTRALCVGDTSTARELLQAALRLRTAIGASAAAAVTQHNLSLLVAPPPPPDDGDDPAGSEDDGGATALEDHHGVFGFAQDGAPVGSQGHAGATAAHSSSGSGVGAGTTAISAKALAIGASLVVVPALVAGLVVLGSGDPAGAAVALDQRDLSFGAAAVNQAGESRTLTARNLGGTAIHLDGFRTSGANSSDFVVTTSTCRDREIEAGATCTADVVFNPTGAGPREASLLVDVREVDDDPTATLSGTSTEPDGSSPTAVPTVLSFGDQPLNASSGRRQVVVTGAPGTPVVLGSSGLSGLDAADFVVESDDCSGAQLVPGATCTVGVRFTPSGAGPRQGLLTLPGPEGVPAVTVPLNGTGVAPPSDPAFRVDPRALSFGALPVGSPSTPEQVVLTNSGQAPLDVAAVSVVGSPDFAVTDAACPVSLAPSQDCVVTVVFAPVTTGPRTAQLYLGGDGPAVPLSGSGTTPPAAAPDISPRALDFAEVLVGDLSPPQDVVVTNRADRPLQLTTGAATSTAGAFRLDGAACAGAAVPPGGSCVLTVRFAPTTAGAHSGVLLLTAEGFPDAAVVLSGLGVRRDTPLVPDVIGLPLAQAQRMLDAVGLATGGIEQVPHPDIPQGAVADQSPRPGVPVPGSGSVDLFVSSGPPTVAVPDVVGLSRSDAAQQILDADLRVGSVSERADPSVEAGVVLESAPPGGTQVAAGSDVDLVVSVASACTVPELFGLSQGDAAVALEAADLSVGRVAQGSDPSLEAGTVLESSPAAGSGLPCGSPVDLVVVSPTTPVIDCTVPDVVGMTRDQAAAAIEEAGLAVGPDTRTSDRSPSGTVLGTEPAAGSTPECGSTVTVVVSSGPEPCTVPQVVGMTQDEATADIRNAGLTVGEVTEDPQADAEDGTVVASDPAARADVDCGSSVGLVVAVAPPCTVPQVVGMTEQEARTAISDARLTVGDVSTEASSSASEGEVLRTDPAGGSMPECGSTVTIVVSSGPEPCTVPDVEGAQRDAAVAAIRDAGLVAAERSGASSEEAGTVLDLQPAAGSTVECGSTIMIVVSSGPDLCTVPTVVGLSRTEAEQAIRNAGLTVGAVTPDYEVSTVVSSSPAAGEEEECGSSVALEVVANSVE